jgi:hypothetical protein
VACDDVGHVRRGGLGQVNGGARIGASHALVEMLGKQDK